MRRIVLTATLLCLLFIAATMFITPIEPAYGQYDRHNFATAGESLHFFDAALTYWGTDKDVSAQWDNTNSEFDITTTGEVRVTCSAVSDGQYGMHVTGAIAGATKSEGVAAYFHSTITGNLDGPTYNLGSWMDITSGTPTSGLLSAIDCGIYESGATLTANTVAILTIQSGLDSTNPPSAHYMMRFNAWGGDKPDAWINAANPESICWTSNTGTSAVKRGAIKINIAGTNYYIRTYDNYN